MQLKVDGIALRMAVLHLSVSLLEGSQPGTHVVVKRCHSSVFARQAVCSQVLWQLTSLTPALWSKMSACLLCAWPSRMHRAELDGHRPR